MEEHSVEEEGGAFDRMGNIASEFPGRDCGHGVGLIFGGGGRVEVCSDGEEFGGVAPGGYRVLWLLLLLLCLR